MRRLCRWPGVRPGSAIPIASAVALASCLALASCFALAQPCDAMPVSAVPAAVPAALASPVMPAPMPDRERVLHCGTLSDARPPGRHAPIATDQPLYAPVRSAMFFSRAGSDCRWHHGGRRSG